MHDYGPHESDSNNMHDSGPHESGGTKVQAHDQGMTAFVVPLFYGHSKPDDVHILLYDLLLELKELETKEICVNNKTFKLKLRAFICDAPARQMIKCIRSHYVGVGCMID